MHKASPNVKQEGSITQPSNGHVPNCFTDFAGKHNVVSGFWFSITETSRGEEVFIPHKERRCLVGSLLRFCNGEIKIMSRY